MLHQGSVMFTGAAGFIGSFVAAHLAEMGMQVAGCDNFNDYYAPQLKRDRVEAMLSPAGVVCEEIELADAAQVESLFERTRPDYLVHLAAQAGVRHSLDNPSAYVQSNLVGFANILETCRRWQPHHLLYASSSSVYGAATQVPFREDDRVDEPVSLYAATKRANELMAHTYSHLYGLRATGLRFFTVYGPWGRPDMAYFSFTEKMLNKTAIPVYAEGRLMRDFTYIDDIVEGLVRVLLRERDAAAAVPHAIFNIGNRQPVQVIDFIRTLERILGVEAELEFLPMQSGDVPVTCADTSRLRQLIGFEPDTPLEEGLARFCDWYAAWSSLSNSAAGMSAAGRQQQHRHGFPHYRDHGQ